MSALWLNVECSPGSDIKDAVTDARELARKLDLTVTFDFNGVHCMVGKNAFVDIVVEKYHEALTAKRPLKIISG